MTFDIDLTNIQKAVVIRRMVKAGFSGRVGRETRDFPGESAKINRILTIVCYLSHEVEVFRRLLSEPARIVG